MIVKNKLTTLALMTILTFAPTLSHAKDVKPKIVSPKKSLLHTCSKRDTNKIILACAVYFEARSEGIKGAKLVAHVILNRTGDAQFPDSVKRVVYQQGQFTYTQRKDFRVYEDKAWEEAQAIATVLLYLNKNFPEARKALDTTKGSLYYKTKSTKAKWTKQMRLVYEYKEHQFYTRRNG